jgi:signal transduction histidine kinase/CheY-like chemotaxis protein/ABC-type phosphate/phosphonate transport system substrate-binding protein
MPSDRRSYTHILLLLALGMLLPAVNAQSTQRIAVPLNGSMASTTEHWTPLLKHLRASMPGNKFQLSVLSPDDTLKALRRGEAEFAVVLPRHVPDALVDGGASVLATATIPDGEDKPLSRVAGSILVLKDRNDLSTLESLKEKRVIALGSHSLAGWIAPSALLRAAKLDPESDFGDLRFASDTATVLDALNAGVIDAAILSNAEIIDAVRSGKTKPEAYRALTASGSTSLDAALRTGSTEPLPLEAFVRAATSDDAIAASVGQALLRTEGKPSEGNILSWTAPVSYSGVSATLREAGLAVAGDPEPPASSPLGPMSTFITGLISLIASLAAFRLYTMMRAKEKVAQETVDAAKHEVASTQQALARAGQMRASLLANFRQDFRTPLSAVLEISRLLRTTQLSSAQVEYVNAIRETTHNLMGSIGNVTDFASLESGALQIEKRDFDLMEVIDTALLNVYEQMGEHHAELSVQVDVNVPRALVGDPNRIRQVLQNLLHNAMKFTHSGDVLLHISRIREDDKAVAITFTVIDTGVGMSRKELKTIFEPYAVQNGSNVEGRGLGLPLCKLLVEKLGGEINATSDTGKGTQVTFSLLLNKQTHDLALRDDDTSRIKGSRILLIGGSDIGRRIQKYYLQAWKADVVYAPRFEEAVDIMKTELAEKRRFDAVLCPAFVGERNAVELVATVRDHPEFDGVPFVAIASRQECEALPQLEQLAGVLILPRPVRRGDLVIKLTEALRMEVPDRLWKDPSDYDAEEIHKLDFAFSDSNIARGLVLVADANTIHQRAVSLVLERIGYEVETATSGDDALALLKRRRFDMAFVDTRLRDRDGFQVASELRDHENRATHTPMVGMLANLKEGEREHCLLSGMDDCILKPLDMETIARTMRRWTRKAQKPVIREESVLRQEKLA